MSDLKERILEAAKEWVEAQDCWATQMTDKGYDRVRAAEDSFEELLDSIETVASLRNPFLGTDGKEGNSTISDRSEKVLKFTLQDCQDALELYNHSKALGLYFVQDTILLRIHRRLKQLEASK